MTILLLLSWLLVFAGLAVLTAPSERNGWIRVVVASLLITGAIYIAGLSGAA